MSNGALERVLKARKQSTNGNLADYIKQYASEHRDVLEAQRMRREESAMRGQQLVAEQIERDANLFNRQAVGDFARQSADAYLGRKDPLRGGLDMDASPGGNAQAFQNAQRTESLDDAYNRIMGNAVMTDEGKQRQLYDTIGGILPNPVLPDRYSYNGITDYIRQTNAKQVGTTLAMDNMIRRREEKKQAEEDKRKGNAQRVMAINRALKQAEQEAENVRSSESAVAGSKNVQDLLDKRTELVNELAAVQSQLTPYGDLDDMSVNAFRQANDVFNELKTREEELTAQIKEYDTQLENAYNYTGSHDLSADIRVMQLRDELQEAEKSRYSALKYNPDFSANSGIPENADLTKDIKLGYINGELYDVVDGTVVPRSARTGKGIDFGTDKNPWSFVDKLETLQYVTKDERATYNYLYNTEGEESADKYLESLMPDLNARERQRLENKATQWSEHHPALSSLQSVIANPGKIVSFAGQMADYLDDGNADQNAWYNRNAYVTDTARSAVGEYYTDKTVRALESKGISKEKAEWWGKAVNFGYGTTMSMADFLFNAFLTGGFNGGEGVLADVAQNLSLAIMGAESSATSYIAAKDRGLTDDQAILLSAIAGLAEVVTEKVSVENLFSEEWEEEALKYFIKNLVSEGAEEGASDLINWTADFLVARDKNEWRTAFEAKKAADPNLSDKDAWKQVIGEKAVEIGLDMFGGALSGGLMAGSRIALGKAGDAAYNAQFKAHNNISSYDAKNKTNVGKTVDGMLADLIKKPKTEWASGLADIANQLRAVNSGNPMNNVRDYIRETARNATNDIDRVAYNDLADFLTSSEDADGNPLTDANGKKLDNRKVVWDIAQQRNNENTAEAQVATETKEAPAQTAEQTAPSTAETAPSTESSTETAAPSTETSTQPVQTAPVAQTQPVAEQTAQNVSQISQESVQEENAVPASNNAAEENTAQNAPTGTTKHNVAKTYENALKLPANLSVEDTAKHLMRRAMVNSSMSNTTGDLVAHGVAKTVTDAQLDILNRMRNSGEYSAEELKQISAKMAAVDKAAVAISRGEVQKYANALQATLKRYGVNNVVVDDTMVNDYENGVKAERGKYDRASKTVHLSPLLDTEEAIAGVVAHEVFHRAENGSERNALLDDVLKAKDTILSGSGVSATGRVEIEDIPESAYVKAYADDLINTFGLTEEGRRVLNEYAAGNPGTRSRAALMKAVYERDGDLFWNYFNPGEDDNARDYIREEQAAHFIQQLGSANGNAIMRELLRDNRTALQKFIDGVRKLLKMPERQISKEEAYRNLVNAYERAVAEEAGTEAREANKVATPNDIPKSDSFKMSRTVERVGDLVAVHNLDETKYLDTHELGGFPAPSIAIVKAKTGHSSFGPISVVFTVDSIDPHKDSRNKIYGGDAWTPTFPRIEYNTDHDAIWNADEALFKLAKNIPNSGRFADRHAMSHVFAEVEAYSSVRRGVQYAAKNITLKLAYAAKNGINIPLNNNTSLQNGREIINNAVSDRDVAQWIEPFVNQTAGESGIRTEDDNPNRPKKDFSDTHIPVTAESIVAEMYKNQSRSGEGVAADAEGISSVTRPVYASIDEVRADKEKLNRLPEQDYASIIIRVDNYLKDCIEEIAATNGGVDTFVLDEPVLEAARTDHSDEAIRDVFDDYGRAITPSQIRTLQSAFRLASQLPTTYFEAKPERVIPFSEVAYYIVPDQASEEVFRTMEQDGAEIRTYTDGDETDRLRVLNSLKNVRFSKDVSATELSNLVEEGQPLSPMDEIRASRELDEKYQAKATQVNNGKYNKKGKLTKQGTGNVDPAVLEQAGKDRAEVKAKLEEVKDKANLPEDITGNTYIANGSYNGTEENTTVCIRSLALDRLCDAIAEKIGRPLTVEESVFVSQSAFNWTQMPQCMYCYVAMDRMAKRQYLLEYINKRNQVIADIKSGMSRAEAFEAFKERETAGGKKFSDDKAVRFNRWADNYEKNARAITMSDVASERAAERALADKALHDEAEDALGYAQSASWAKSRIGFTAYNNHILNWKQDRIDNLNSMFGLRMYSFSDYSPAFALENMQMITDAAVKGLKMLAYTKDLDFVKIFAPTGMNINISVFSMNQRDADGNFAQDGMQGADWKQAQALRDQYPGVGITYVATSDEQVDWALDQDWIDVIIPFHMVKTGAKVANIMGYNNYTGESSDRTLEGNKKAEIYPNEHQNSKEKYLSIVEERKLKPRFERWKNHPNYMKLVNETRRSAGDTPAVQPRFNTQEALKSIEGMVRRGGYNVPIGGSLEKMNQIAEKISGDIEKGFAENISIKNGIIYQDGKPIQASLELENLEDAEPTTDNTRKSREIPNDQTETAAFIDWFGDWQNYPENASKVVNADGTPKVVYHGTSENFNEFVAQMKNGGTHPYHYFSENLDYAKDFMKRWGKADNATYKEVYLDIKKPLDLTGKKQTIEHWSDVLRQAGVEIAEDYLDEIRGNYGDDVYGWQLFRDDTGEFYDAVRDAGYDGIKTTEFSGDTTWVAFDSRQVKSATDNIGTFDRNNPDIRYSREVTPEQDQEYMEAVESGDTEKQQQMVDDAAKKAGYTVRKWHQTNVPNIHVFDLGIGTHGGTDSETPYGVFTKSTNRDIGLGNVQMQLLLKAGKTFTINNREELRSKMPEAYKLLAQELEAVDAKYESLAQEAEDALFEAQDAYEEKHPDVEISIEDIVNNRTYDDPDCQKANERWKAVMTEWQEEANKIRIRAKGVLTDYLKANNYDSMEIKLDRGSNGRSTDTFIVLSPEQVKSADPVTYDNDGNPIPLSERFNPENEDIRYSREMQSLDEEYQKALDSGDEEAEERIVREAAKKAGYSRKVYHGGADVTVFDTDRGADGTTQLGAGTYVTNSKYYASEWAEEREGKVTNLYLKDGIYFEGDGDVPDSPQWEELKTILKDKYGFTDKDIRIVQEWGMERLVPKLNKNTERVRGIFQNADTANDVIRAAGYDGIHASFYDGEQWCVFNPQDLKSADPVTYDDNGDVIPPSERFNPENNDIRWSREVESETERKLRREQDKNNYLKTQLTRFTAFGDAKSIAPTAFDDIVSYYSRMYKGDISPQKIRDDLRGLYDIMERPKKGQDDTPEKRWAEVNERARQIAREWAEETTYEKVFREELGDEDVVNALTEFWKLIMGRGSVTDGEGKTVASRGYYYIIPDMIAEAGDKETFNQIRRSLRGMKLKGFNSLAEAQASGRTSIDQLYQTVSQDGNAYNSLFESEGELSSGEINGDFAKLQRIAEVADLAWEAINDPYTKREFNEDAINEQAEMLMNDFINRWREKAKPTKMSQTFSENDMRRAMAEGEAGVGVIAENARNEGYEEGYQRGQFENAVEVGAAKMREDMMEQRFAEDADRLRRNYERMSQEDAKKIARLESRIEQRNQTEAARLARNNLLRKLNRLNTLLEHPTRNQHIPQALRTNLARFLQNISQTDTRLLNGKTISYERMQEIQNREAEAIKNLASDFLGGLNGMSNAADNSTIRLTADFIDQLTDKVQWLQEIYGQMQNPNTKYRNRIDDLAVTRNVGYLKQMNQIVDMVIKALNDQNTYIIDGKYRDAVELSALLSNDLDGKASRATGMKKKALGELASDKLRGMAYETMSADMFFSDMGDNWRDIIAHSYRQGQNRQAQHEKKYVESMKDIIGDYKVRNSTYLVTVPIHGQEVTMQRGQLMHLYALWNRPAGQQHLENGGGCILNEKGEEFRENTRIIDEDTAKAIFSYLTEQEKQIADDMVKFMSDEVGEWGNEASTYMYGYRMYEDPHYVPLDVVDYALPKDLGSKKGTRSIEHASFTKNLKRDASAPLRISNLFDVTDDHVRRMAAYNAYAPITNDMNRILQMPGMNEKIQNRMGRRGMKYLTDFVETVAANEVRSGEMAESAAPLNFLMNAYKRQAVAWNVSTMLKQPISILRAANEIDGKYLRQALGQNLKLGKAEYQRIKNAMENNSGVAYIKSNGYSDVGFGATLRKLYSNDYVNDSGIIRGALSSTKGGTKIINAYDKFIEKGMEGAGLADEATWVNIWKACELEVADKNPNLTGKEFTKKVTERFNDVIGKTQVVDTVLDTSPLMRNKAMQIFTPFMNEPTKSLSGLITAADAWRDKKPGAAKAFGKAIGLYLFANLFVEPIITSLMQMWRDEKDDTDDFWWNFLEKMLGIKHGKDEKTTVADVLNSNMVSNLAGFPILNNFFDTIVGAMKGYSNSKIDTAALSELVSKSTDLVNNLPKKPEDRAKTTYRLWGDWVEAVAAVTGIPAKTIRRQIAGTARAAIDIADARELQWAYNKLYYNIENATARSQKGFYDILAQTYLDGDIETYQKMMSELNDIVTDKSTLIDEKSIRQAIEKRGGEVKPGTDIWNVDVQARFRLDQPVKGWKVENFLTGAYVTAEKAGIDKSAYDDVLLNMPDAYSYTDEEGDTVKMSPADYLQYAADVGQLSYRVLAEMSSPANAKQWASLNPDQKVVAIRDVYKYAKCKYKKDYNEDYNIHNQGKWMDKLYEENATPAQIAKAALDQGAAYKDQLKRDPKKKG